MTGAKGKLKSSPFLTPLLLLYFVEVLGEEATHKRLEIELNRDYTSVYRYLRMLKTIAKVEIRLSTPQELKSAVQPPFYIIDDWGIINKKKFLQSFKDDGIKPMEH